MLVCLYRVDLETRRNIHVTDFIVYCSSYRHGPKLFFKSSDIFQDDTANVDVSSPVLTLTQVAYSANDQILFVEVNLISSATSILSQGTFRSLLPSQCRVSIRTWKVCLSFRGALEARWRPRQFC